MDLDLGPPLSDFDGYLLDQQSGESTLPEIHLSDYDSGSTNVNTQETSANINLFSPDEEDVENQLMHIDDQLIRLDDDIENINEGVQRTLDEAIMVHNLRPEAIKEGLDEEMEEYPFQDEDSNSLIQVYKKL